MDVESPASPGIESPASPTSAPAIPVIAEAPEEPEHVEEEPIADVSVGARASAGVEYQRKAYSSPEWCEKYRKITAIYEAFMKLTAMGDVTSVYRRAVWVSLPATELVAPASDAFNCIPASSKTGTVYPKRRVRPRGRGSHACEQSTSSYLLCVSRFIVVFLISSNDQGVTWTAWADSSFRIHCK
ncbi:hypothetical protein Y032_0227g2846 [Ancylostoma ceylanicum]|nr:hypothetical protein Y032_0227g2846 [Ancylostoma ceylanicum]